MILINENILISEDILEKMFCCDLVQCKGMCCFEGDAGAPLSEAETETLENIWEVVSLFVPEEGRAEIEKMGFFDLDNFGEPVTPLNTDGSCAFSYKTDGVYYCAIENAWREGLIDFQKPISCHLYPIRESKLHDAIGLNLHRWAVCEPAYTCGKASNVPVYMAVKDALIRRFGADVYQQIEIAAEYLNNKKQDYGNH
ncbi:MAG: DUF3109 family protein [Bacteroidetes bacterium]|nr:DUF3109 family protein [Bacteroidota bacterium]MBU1717572.1 DUF3109 family protein [Bacteroidota bacterium]